MEKKNPIKNYILLTIITIATIVFVIYFVSFYEKRKKYENSLNTRMDFLLQIKEKELKNYITENHDTIIYVSDSSDETYKDYEEQLKKMLTVKNLTKEIVYLDISKTKDSFYDNIKKTYFVDNLKQYEYDEPNVLIVTNGKISHILYKKGQSKEPKDIIYFVEKNLEENN